MSATNSLHYQLCCEGARYIIQPRAAEPWQSPNSWSTVELVCFGTELTDVYATNSSTSTIIEVKTSHADFLRDKRKYARTKQAEIVKHQIGDYRYYLCPEGIIKVDELPDGWGLLYWDGKKVSKVVSAPRKWETDHRLDMFVLCSIIARECGRHKIFNYRKKNNEE